MTNYIATFPIDKFSKDECERKIANRTFDTIDEVYEQFGLQMGIEDAIDFRTVNEFINDLNNEMVNVEGNWVFSLNLIN